MTNIYALIDPISYMIRYVGKSNNLYKRYLDHCNRNDDTHPGRWIKKLKSFNLIPLLYIVEECDESIWQERERYWIYYYRNLGCNLTNLTDGGEGLHNPSQETRSKLHKFNIGKKLSDETRKKIGIAGIGRYHSLESIHKMSEIKLGKNNPRYGIIETEEVKCKKRESMIEWHKIHKHPMKGKHQSKESIRKRIESRKRWNKLHGHNLKGYHFSDAVKENMRKAQQLRRIREKANKDKL